MQLNCNCKLQRGLKCQQSLRMGLERYGLPKHRRHRRWLIYLQENIHSKSLVSFCHAKNGGELSDQTIDRFI